MIWMKIKTGECNIWNWRDMINCDQLQDVLLRWSCWKYKNTHDCAVVLQSGVFSLTIFGWIQTPPCREHFNQTTWFNSVLLSSYSQ